ncbi:FAD dependent oxidoreductase [Caballeronia calidae]|uniref:FAD dependent oxidoreductase n=1 Tax=Caballeronia calidae TaxID=1777139 RepID=A0A158E813_9BURK|nr:FAD/NAD(P)-binding protein [Caballeronia calidae]SAL02850.1 FAD dependent oxidoreductase [Caballeronia calidae]
MNETISTIAVIGGGSVATSFVYQLLHALELPPRHTLRVLVFEPSESIGPGQAYQTDANSNLLNIPASSMSAIANERDDFVRWLRARSASYLASFGVSEIDPKDVFPRPLFGAYLRDVYRRCQRKARELGVALEHVRARVCDIEAPASGTTVRVVTESGNGYVAQRVVLCNGNLPSVAFADLHGDARYFNSPYPVSELTSRIGRDDSVCIVGTSLSAVDAIVALARGGHRGRIVAVSRNGRLPSVKSPHNPSLSLTALCPAALDSVLEGEDGATLEALGAMLHSALVAAGGAYDPADVIGLRDGDALAALTDELARARSGPRLWQAVAASTNECIEHLWHALGDLERQRFLRDFRSLWMARRATFPLRNAEQIHERLASGQLSIVDGFAGLYRPCKDGPFNVRRSRNAGGFDTLECDWVVNATSFSTSIRETRDPLIRMLVQRGLAREDAAGGVALEFDTGCLVTARGVVERRVSLIGSLATGAYFWTTSMDINARLAGGQAQALAASIREAGMARVA